MTRNVPLSPNDEPEWYETIQVKFEDLDIMFWDFLDIKIASSLQDQPVTITLEYPAGTLAELPIWLVQIADNRLPEPLSLDGVTSMAVTPLSNDRLDFRLTTRAKADKNPECILRVIVKRKQFVSEFAKKLKGFARDNYLREGWAITGEQLKAEADKIMIAVRKS